MLVIRTYALYERSKRVLVILIVTHVAGAIMCLVGTIFDPPASYFLIPLTQVAVVTNLRPVDTLTPLPFKFTGCDLSLTNYQ